ncbi:hypothetical protein ABE096_23940 [Robertmurraya massiliosenegalensis]|uniref:hypothetical protein n=1 Tax=Robertmurraya TaxID=2837507 RepID=UPI0039A4F8EE
MGTSKGYLPPTGHLWSDAKRAVSGIARNNLSSSSIGKAMSNFSKATASGGSRQKSDSIIAKSGAKVIGFSGLVRQVGLANALDQVGLTHLKGKDPHTIILGLVDYFSESTNTIQQSIANQAIQDYMLELMNGIETESETEAILSNLDSETFIMDYLSKYMEVYFFTNFAEKISSLCKDIQQTIKMQDRIKEFIRLEIKQNYNVEGLENVDWRGREGERYIQQKCNQIWSIFENWGD